MAALEVRDTNLIRAPLVCRHAAVGVLETDSAHCREKPAATARVLLIVPDARPDRGNAAMCGMPEALSTSSSVSKGAAMPRLWPDGRTANSARR